jgi:NADH:ubiquinone oxidoreductase subunit 5 (subunit L)/multisubunit Na+/H+ antiporter MnhA subunit
MLTLYAITLPLIAFLILFIKTYSISEKKAKVLVIFFLVISLLLELYEMYSNLEKPKIQLINLGNWFTIGFLKVDFLLY